MKFGMITQNQNTKKISKTTLYRYIPQPKGEKNFTGLMTDELDGKIMN